MGMCREHMSAGVQGRADARTRSYDPPVVRKSSLAEERESYSLHREYALQSARCGKNNVLRESGAVAGGSRTARSNGSGIEDRRNSAGRGVGKQGAITVKSARGRVESRNSFSASTLTPRQAEAESILKKMSMVPDDMYDSDDAPHESQRTCDYLSAQVLYICIYT